MYSHVEEYVCIEFKTMSVFHKDRRQYNLSNEQACTYT